MEDNFLPLNTNLTLEERVMALEQQFSLLYDLTLEIQQTHTQILNAFFKLEKTNSNQIEELKKQIDKVNLQQMNFWFIFNTLYPITEEQKIKIEEAKKKLKNKEE